MTKLVRTESASEDKVWVKMDKSFVESLPPKFFHLECPRCACAKFNIAHFGTGKTCVKVGCSHCSWEFEMPYEYIGSANVLLPV